MNRNRSRLSQRQNEKTKGQVIWLSVILIVMLLFLFFFGAKIIGLVGNIVFHIRGNKNQIEQIVSKDYLEPPFLDPLPDATPSAEIKVTGSTQYRDGSIDLLVNNTEYKNIDVKTDGKFEQDTIKLDEGNNIIKARVKKDNKMSDFSQSYTVTYTKSPPKLDLSSPSDGQQFQKADQNITVQGKTDADSTVTVNDHRAVVNDDGSFSSYIPLHEGDNDITVDAVSTAGEKIEKKIKVHYQP